MSNRKTGKRTPYVLLSGLKLVLENSETILRIFELVLHFFLNA